MSTHYRQPLDWNDQLMEDCYKTLDKWYSCYLELNKKVLIDEDDLMPLYDDLNTPGYISVLHKLFDKAKSGSQEDKEKFVAGCNFVGLLEESKEDWLSFKKVI